MSEVSKHDPTLAMKDVAFAYPSTGFSLAVPEFQLNLGERVFLRGPSGSGKSTFLALATGLLAPDYGMVAVAGKPMPDRAAARDALRADAIGIIHQQFNLLPYLDTLSNVLLPLAFGRDVGSAAGEKAGSLLENLGIPAKLHSVSASSLSVGQQQRVAIARALLGKPSLIVADEPTSALDVITRNAFLDVLFNSISQTGSALLMVSHDPEIGKGFDRSLDLSKVAEIHRTPAA